MKLRLRVCETGHGTPNGVPVCIVGIEHSEGSKADCLVDRARAHFQSDIRVIVHAMRLMCPQRAEKKLA
jgi:hypothetical protein